MHVWYANLLLYMQLSGVSEASTETVVVDGSANDGSGNEENRGSGDEDEEDDNSGRGSPAVVLSQ